MTEESEQNFSAMILILAIILPFIEVDLIAICFPNLVRDFGESYSGAIWSVVYFFFGFFFGTFCVSFLIELQYKREVILASYLLLVVCSIWAALAPNIFFYIQSRMLAGVGASGVVVGIYSIFGEIYEGKKVQGLYGMMLGIISLFMCAAPFVAYMVYNVLGWRAIHLIEAILGGICWIFVFETLRTNGSSKEEKLSKARRIIFTVENLFSLAGKPSFMLYVLLPSFSFAGHMLFLSLGPLIYMVEIKISMAEYIFHQAAVILIFSGASIISGISMNRIDRRKLILLGCLFHIVSSVMLFYSLLKGYFAPIYLTISIAIFAVGSGIICPCAVSKIMSFSNPIKTTTTSYLYGVRALVAATFVTFATFFVENSVQFLSLALFVCALAGLFILKLITKYENHGKISGKGDHRELGS